MGCCYEQSKICGGTTLSGLWLDTTSIPASNTIKQGSVCYYFNGSNRNPLCPGTLHSGYTTVTGCSDPTCSGTGNCTSCTSGGFGTRTWTISGFTGTCSGCNGSGTMTLSSLIQFYNGVFTISVNCPGGGGNWMVGGGNFASTEGYSGTIPADPTTNCLKLGTYSLTGVGSLCVGQTGTITIS